VCPWCYVGMARFERAIAAYGRPVDIALHPFQLDAGAPIPGVSAAFHYERKFGPQYEEMFARVTSAANEAGLQMHMDGAITANTFDAHRAIAYARASGRDRELEQRYFTDYFVAGKDVSDRSVLADGATAVGIDRAAIAAYLASDDGVDALRKELSQAMERGITAVPAFVFNEQFLVPGAVDEASFVKIFEQIDALGAKR
jgi:predicted DsbA family dithiol-disulfide isomerase